MTNEKENIVLNHLCQASQEKRKIDDKDFGAELQEEESGGDGSTLISVPSC